MSQAKQKLIVFSPVQEFIGEKKNPEGQKMYLKANQSILLFHDTEGIWSSLT